MKGPVLVQRTSRGEPRFSLSKLDKDLFAVVGRRSKATQNRQRRLRSGHGRDDHRPGSRIRDG